MKYLSIFVGIACSFFPLAAQAQLDPQDYLEGPDAPEVYAFYSLAQNAIEFNIANSQSGNMINEMYAEIDTALLNLGDPAYTWRFQGFLIYQVLHDSVTPQQWVDPAYARLAAQSDLQDTVVALYNTFHDQASNNCFTTEMVNGNNAGTVYTYQLTTDLFTGQPFQADQTYCFVAVAYASNLYRTHDICAGDPQQFIRSKKSAFGGIGIYCISGLGTGNEELNALASVELYPNPTTGTLNINAPTSEAITVTILDGSGRVVQQQQIQGTNSIEMENLAAGYYFVELMQNDGQRIVRQIQKY